MPEDIDYEARERIMDLESRICELQAFSILTLAELRAVKELAIIVWESQQVKVDATRDIATVLESMQREWVDVILPEFADIDMTAATKLKQNIDRYLKKKK
jgi:hypothetical protein